MTTPHVLQRVCHRIGYAPRSDDGFTLVEVVVAFVIFMAVAGGALVTTVGGQTAQRNTQDAVGRANVAQQQLAQARALPRSVLTATPTATSTATVGPRTYTTTRTVSYLPATVTACPSLAATATDAPHEIRVSVVVRGAGDSTRSTRLDAVIPC